MEANKLINDLSVAEKIELYNCLYEDLSGKGIDGDTELAHVNVQEMAVLRAMGGSGTINPHTNLIQFIGGGGGSPPPPPPATQTVTQQATIPDELKPFVTDVLEKAQAIQERREVEGYVPFSGPRIAEFSPEQTQAFESIKGLVGQGQQYFDPATRLTAASAFAPTAPQVSQFMNPYLQNVVDIQQREARRAADVERQQLGAQAVGAGGFGGSRQAILEAEQARNLQQQLGDIQARGLASAYEDAQARLQQQRERERLAGAQFATLGQVAPGQAFRELSALEAIGAQRQQQQQQALDIAQQEYEIARTFPERTLQDYQSIIRGYAAPIPASTVTRSQTTTPAPSFLQQAAGLGFATAGVGKALGGFKEGGLISLADGGRPQVELLRNMSDIDLTKAASDPNFSTVLIERERQRRRDKLRADNRLTNEEIFRRALERRDDSLKRGNLSERRAQATAAMREIFPAAAEESSLPSDTELVRQNMQDRASQLRRTVGDVSSINNALEERKKIMTEEQRLAEKRAPSTTTYFAKRSADREAAERGDYKTLMSLSQQSKPIKSLVERLEEEGKPTTGFPNLRRLVPARPYGQGVEDYGGLGLQTEKKQTQRAVRPSSTTSVEVPLNLESMYERTSNAPVPAVKPAPTPIDIGSGLPESAITDMDEDVSAIAANNNVNINNPAAKSFASGLSIVNPYQQQITDLTGQLSDITKKEREDLTKLRKDIDQDKWMQLANFGFSILAQPGGQTLLEAVGKGAKESQLIGNLSKLNDKQRALALNASQLDRRELQDKLGLTKTQADMYDRERMYDLKVMELEASIALSKDKARQNALSRQLELLKFDHQIKKTDAELTSKEQQTRLKMLPSTSNEEGLKIYERQFDSFMSDPTKLSGGIRTNLEKLGVIDKGILSDSFKTDFKKQAFPIFIPEYRKYYSEHGDPTKAERQAINSTLNNYLKNR